MPPASCSSAMMWGKSREMFVCYCDIANFLVRRAKIALASPAGQSSGGTASPSELSPAPRCHRTARAANVGAQPGQPCQHPSHDTARCPQTDRADRRNSQKEQTQCVLVLKGKGKGFPYSTPIVGPELIPVYRQSACR